MPPGNESRKKKDPQTRNVAKAKSLRGSKEHPPKHRPRRRIRALRKASGGLDPRQAIDQWCIFAQKSGYDLVTRKRRFDSDLEFINTVIQEERSLYEFCRHSRISLSESLAKLVEGPPTRIGYEHRVFYSLKDDPPRVTKVTFPDKYGRKEHTPFLYLERLALGNALFPVLDIRFEDCIRAGDDKFSIVSSMRAFLGPHPSLLEIDVFLSRRGFSKLQSPLTIDYTNREIRIHLRDCHSKNWVKSRDGVLIPVDVIPEKIV